MSGSGTPGQRCTDTTTETVECTGSCQYRSSVIPDVGLRGRVDSFVTPNLNVWDTFPGRGLLLGHSHRTTPPLGVRCRTSRVGSEDERATRVGVSSRAPR